MDRRQAKDIVDRESGRIAGPAPDLSGELRGDTPLVPDEGKLAVHPNSGDESADAPYRITTVRSVDELMRLGTWLQSQAASSEAPLGIAAQPLSVDPGLEIAFASKHEAWHLPEVPPDQEVVRSVLEAALCVRGGPSLVTRDLVPTFDALKVFLHVGNEELQELLGHFIGSLTDLGYVLGRRVHMAGDFMSAAEDALDVCMTEPQLAIDAPLYYANVALPIAKNTAMGWREPEEGECRFQVTYENLFLRALAFFTGDPTLRRALEDDEDTLEILASKLQIRREQILPFFAWVTLNGDAEAFAFHLPSLRERLPEDPHVVQRMLLDKTMPVVRNWLIEEEQLCLENRGSVTHYGRPSYFGVSPGSALYHRVFGTVRDIIQVAKASLLLGQTECLLETGTAWWERASVVGHTQADPLLFRQETEHLCALGDPLTRVDGAVIPLEPRVSVD